MSDEGERTCPLCAEEMDLTDQQLKPCKCGYEICVWCWHHIMDMAEKDDSEGRCPACRNPYDKEKIVGMAANCERLVAEINVERKKSQRTKTKPSEGRKQLSSVRVIQRNLVYIVGLPLNLADEDLLQRREYFGQYGKVLKVSMSRTAAGVIQQFPNNSCSVYITYSKEEEAIRCIQSVHGFVLDGRSLKACFGTTKYCHAWLRNVPCTNPDCLYLHDIGSQEDSFTKDEIISAYTRSRVQQITGTTNSSIRRPGSILPPPLDDYSCYNTSSEEKPIVKTSSDNSMSTSKGSPPNGSLGKSIALPAAASWGARVANQPQVVNSTPTKPKPDIGNDTLAFSSAVVTSTQLSSLHSDTGKRAVWNEDSQSFTSKGKLDNLKSVKQNNCLDFRASILDMSAMNEITAPLTSSNLSSSSPSSEQNNWGSVMVSDGSNSFVQTEPSSDSEKGGAVVTEMPSIKIDCNTKCDITGVARTNGADHSMIKSPGSHGLHQQFVDQYREPLALAANQINSTSIDQSDWRKEPHNAAGTSSEVEEDIISFDNQRLKDPEVVNHTSFLPNSANSLHHSDPSRSHSLQHNQFFGTLNTDQLYADNNRAVDRSLLHSSSNNIIASGYPDDIISSSSGLDRNTECTFSLTDEGEGKLVRRSHGDATALDVGESNIISNILSLDLDSWDDSLTSPQNLAKLLGEANKQPSFQISSSWKGQGSSQSRFSFARHEESRNQMVDADRPFSIFGQLQNNPPSGQDSFEKRNSSMDKRGMGSGFSSSNFEESEAFLSAPSVFASNKSSSVFRAAPPGFSVPNRAPPPGFSSQERLNQMFDTIPGNHLLDSSSLLRNSYKAPSAGNISSSGGDIEFIDPAILAVGKERRQGGLNNSGIDMRSNFPQQLSAFDYDARLQLLMQSSISPHQNLRYADIGNGLSSLNDSYGISSRLVDQSQMSNNISPYMQMSLQHARNGLMSNGHWDGRNEGQAGSVAEFLRNERLGLNKFYNTGYEDSKFRMPSSGDLYNRTFEM